VEVVLEIDTPLLSSEQLSSIARTVDYRAFQFSRDSTVTQDGNQIKVTLPGETDIDLVVKKLTERRGVGFYHARSVTSGSGSPKSYEIGSQIQYQELPAYTFLSNATKKEIRPGMAEYAKIISSWSQPILTNEDISKVDAEPFGSSYVPVLSFAPSGAAKIESWSRRYSRTEPQLACVIDGVVVSIAPLQAGAVLSTSSVIHGTFDKEYVLQLQQMFGKGLLTADLLVKSKRKF
jgi:preprotein translocase subunit SecD